MVQDVFEHAELEIGKCLAVIRCKREHWCDGIDEVGARQVVDRAVVDDILFRGVPEGEIVAILAFRPT